MNIKTNLPEEYVNVVDTTTEQITCWLCQPYAKRTYFKINIILVTIIICLFLIFLSYKYLIE